MAAGNMVNIRGSERGLGADLTRLLNTSKARPFNPDLSSEALRIERRGGTSLPCRGAAHSGLADNTLKMSWDREVITGSLLYFRNMAMARGATFAS